MFSSLLGGGSQKAFKKAAWSDRNEVLSFVDGLDDVSFEDMQAFLGMLYDSKLTEDGEKHQKRRLAFFTLAKRVNDTALFMPYLEALPRVDDESRAALVELLPKVNNARGHTKLCELLGHKKAAVREAAAEVLGQVGGKHAFDALARLVASPAFGGRVAALDALVPKAGLNAFPLIAAVLEHGEPAEQIHALEYISKGDYIKKDREQALKALSTALGSNDEGVRGYVLEAITSVGNEDEFWELTEGMADSRKPEVVRDYIGALAKIGSPRAFNMLRRKLREGPDAVRKAVLAALERIGTEDVLPLLVDALASPKVVLRNLAGEVLAKLSKAGQVDVARAILWLLRSRDTDVRRMAADLANEVRGDAAEKLAPRLLDYLTDEDWWVRERVMDALAGMWGTRLTRHIVGYLEDESDLVRRFGVGALKRLADPKSLGALVRVAQGDRDWLVREAAVEAIAAVKDDRAVPYLVDILRKQPEIRLAALVALRELKAANTAGEVAVLLGDGDPDIRHAAVEALDVFGARSEAERLRPLEEDLDYRVRLAARALLQRWKVRAKASAAVAGDSALEQMLLKMVEQGGDDLILAPGRKPVVKLMGQVSPMAEGVLSADDIEALLVDVLSPAHREALAQGRDVDFSYDGKLSKLRFRANVFYQLTGLSAVLRTIKNEISDIEALGLPPIVRQLAELKHGLVMVGGPTGAGKSTTLGAMVDYINSTSGRHILTIEDPIEVLHGRKRSLINQREVGSHTPSFDAALRSSLREDPDVILIGEMRDLDTMSFAVDAAETGHLVLATVHTVSADKSVDRIINSFPAKQQPQIRSMLAETLRGVVCQHLLRRRDGRGRVLAVEVLLGNEAVAALVRKGKTFQIATVIATHGEIGMQTMDSQLQKLCAAEIVTPEEALMRAADKAAFEAFMREKGIALEERQGVVTGARASRQWQASDVVSPDPTRPAEASRTRQWNPADMAARSRPDPRGEPARASTRSWDPSDMAAATPSAPPTPPAERRDPRQRRAPRQEERPTERFDPRSRRDPPVRRAAEDAPPSRDARAPRRDVEEAPVSRDPRAPASSRGAADPRTRRFDPRRRSKD